MGGVTFALLWAFGACFPLRRRLRLCLMFSAVTPYSRRMSCVVFFPDKMSAFNALVRSSLSFISILSSIYTLWLWRSLWPR